MAENIENRVIQKVSEQLGLNAEDVKVDSKFVDDLGADSLDLVELTMSFEEEFGIEIPDEDLPSLVDIGAIAKYINEKLNK